MNAGPEEGLAANEREWTWESTAQMYSLTILRVTGLLREQNFVVPGIENVSTKGLAKVSGTQVRYFNDRDQAATEQVVKVLAQNGFPDAKLVVHGEI